MLELVSITLNWLVVSTFVSRFIHGPGVADTFVVNWKKFVFPGTVPLAVNWNRPFVVSDGGDNWRVGLNKSPSPVAFFAA